MVIRPHVFGLVHKVSENEDGTSQLSIVDFSLNDIVEGSPNVSDIKLLLGVASPFSDRDLRHLQDQLIHLSVIPSDSELFNEDRFMQLYDTLSPHAVRYAYHSALTLLKAEKMKFTGDPVIFSELQRSEQLLRTDKPLLMAEAVKDFLELGPYGQTGRTSLIVALADVSERINRYMDLPSHQEVSSLLLDSTSMTMVEREKHPEWLEHHRSSPMTPDPYKQGGQEPF
jgi:hypothetical protein